LPRKTRSNVSLNRNSIIGSIERSESKGLKVNAIVRDTGLGRATVERYLRDLEGGYIVKKENKQAPYHLTQKLNGDPKSKAFLFQSEAFRQLGILIGYQVIASSLIPRYTIVNSIASGMKKTRIYWISSHFLTLLTDCHP
jgi:predicted transcriptional regulator